MCRLYQDEWSRADGYPVTRRAFFDNQLEGEGDG
jgi:hypothetical protein